MSICLKSAISLALIVGMTTLTMTKQTMADETKPSTVVKKAPAATAQEPSDAEPTEEPPAPSGPSQSARVHVWNDGALHGRTWIMNPDGSLSPAPHVTVVFGREGKTVYRAVSDENARFVVPSIVAPNDYELFASANGVAATMLVSVLPAAGANVKAEEDAKSIKVEEEGKSVNREPTRSEKLVALFRKVSAKKATTAKLAPAPAPQAGGSTLDVVMMPQDEVVVEDVPAGGYAGGMGGGFGGGGGGGGGLGLGLLGLGGLAGLAGLAGLGPASPAGP